MANEARNDKPDSNYARNDSQIKFCGENMQPAENAAARVGWDGVAKQPPAAKLHSSQPAQRTGRHATSQSVFSLAVPGSGAVPAVSPAEILHQPRAQADEEVAAEDKKKPRRLTSRPRQEQAGAESNERRL